MLRRNIASGKIEMQGILKQIADYAKMLTIEHPRIFSPIKQALTYIFSAFWKAEVYSVSGIVKDTNYSMTILFMGSEYGLYQFASLIYSQVNKIVRLIDLQFYNGKSFVCNYSHEIIAIRVERSPFNRFLEENCLMLPNVRFILDLSFSMDDIIKRMSRRRRRDIKRIEDSNYSYIISRSNDAGFDHFYWKMYLPYAKKRFGKAAYIKTYLESKAVYKGNGGIIFVKEVQKPVAGILFQISGKTLYAWSSGIAEDDGHVSTGLAGQAALLFLIEWAKKEGLNCLDYGMTLPFFREGLFMYKKEWGMMVEEQMDQSMCALKINSLSEGSLSFLDQNPFIFTDKRKIKGAIFLSHYPTEIELQQILSDYFLPKLDSLIVVAYYHASNEGADKKEMLLVPHKPLSNIVLLLRKQGFNVEVFELPRQKKSKERQ